MIGKFKKIFSIGIFWVLFFGFMANSLILITGLNDEQLMAFGIVDVIEHENTNGLQHGQETTSKDLTGPVDARGARQKPHGVVGPLELLENNDFSKQGNWTFHNAYNSTLQKNHTRVFQHNQGYVVFEQEEPFTLEETPFPQSNPYRAIIKQRFYKPAWTNNKLSPNNIVVFSFDYIMMYYIGDIEGNANIFGEIYLGLEDPKGKYAEWPLVATIQTTKYNGGYYKTGDSREGFWQYNITQDVSQPPPSYPQFSINSPGWYNFSLIFQLFTNTLATSDQIDTSHNLTVDDLSLRIDDEQVPMVFNEDGIYTFGPYNDNTYNDISKGIDLNFSAQGVLGYVKNTPLNVGKYRLNNPGSPGAWHRIFKEEKGHYFSENWTIADEWLTMKQGKNFIDIFCSDQVGNFNDTVHLWVIKDTQKPQTNITPVPEYCTQKWINLTYTAIDPGQAIGESGGFNNTVILMFRVNQTGDWMKYSPSWNPSGFFKQSPIRFVPREAGNGYGEGKFEFYTIGIDIATNIENAPLSPDATTIFDYNKPSSNAWGVPKIIDTQSFDIDFNFSDTSSGLDHVELWYEVNDDNKWVKWLGGNGNNGEFTQSPISFKADLDGIYGFYTVGYDKAGNIEKGGTPVKLTEPDLIVEVDSKAPRPVFIKPVKDSVISGKTEIEIFSDFDTQYVVVYYWVDYDEDCFGDDVNDVGSKWIRIDTISRDPEVANFNTTWNTKQSSDLFDKEHKVVLKAVAADKTNKNGTNETCVEVDNKAPDVTITNPENNSAENGLFMYINYTTDDDVKFINLYYRIYQKEIKWTTIVVDIVHKPIGVNKDGKTKGSYKWDIPPSLRPQKPKIDIKLEVIDKVSNKGNKIVSVGINWAFPKIRPTFPYNITLEEDFGEWSQKLTEYESHSDKAYTGDNLKWYVTGNSKKIFTITGDFSTGVDADTFEFTSILNQNGVEVLTFHLIDPQGLEDVATQTVTVIPIPDPPIFLPPTETIQVTVDEEDILDLSIYITDVDTDKSDLTLSTNDPEHVTPAGLTLKFNYPGSFKDKERILKVTVSDKESSTSKNLRILPTSNHRPRLVKPLPDNWELWGGVERELDLKSADDPYFMDPDGDDLTFTANPNKNVKITIEGSIVTLEAMPNLVMKETLRFRATDPYDAFVEAEMVVQLRDINNPPRIKDIPDIYVYYYDENKAAEYPGYGYDFSYFIFDPDNDRSELTIRAVPMETELYELGALVEKDPSNNMRLIFKIPFRVYEEYGDDPRPFILFVKDPDPETIEVAKMFNVSVIIDFWPVELVSSIPEQSFKEGGSKEDAFNLLFENNGYFRDRDGGTTYEIVNIDKYKIKVSIDKDYNVDLGSKDDDWNGDEEVVILAYDAQPKQFVYALFKVVVIPVNDPPVIEHIDPIVIQKGKQEDKDLSKYISDVDTDLDKLELQSSDPEHVSTSGLVIYINYNKVGTFEVDIKVVDYDGKFANTTLTIKVEDDKGGQTVLPAWFYSSIFIVIIIVILIIIFLMVLFTRYKVHEVFLIHQSGILLSHLSREHKPGRDEEVLSGMFTAVQEFIKDSFSTSGRAGKTSTSEDYVLREMKIGDNNNILIERGKYAYLAVIFSGRGANKLRTKARTILNQIETKYELPFKTWVGDMDKIAGVEKLLEPLIPEGARPVIVTERYLGRVPEPRPGGRIPGAPSIPTVPAAAARPAVTPTKPAPQLPSRAAAAPPAAAIKPVSIKPVTVTPVSPARATAQAPAKAVTPITPTTPVTPAKPAKPATAVPARPAQATAKPAVAVAAKPAVAPICPKCGATVNKFPDGSTLCPKCGYTG